MIEIEEIGDPQELPQELNYIVRVVLHEVPESGEQYDVLHAAMEAKGFSRTMEFRQGVYHLPPAEYYIRTSETIGHVRQSALFAASSTGRKFRVLCIQAADIMGWYLQKVQEDRSPLSFTEI